MTKSVETLAAEVLELEPADRSRLLDRVIASLDADPEIEAAWLEEAARRDVEADQGSQTLQDGPEVLQRLRRQQG